MTAFIWQGNSFPLSSSYFVRDTNELSYRAVVSPQKKRLPANIKNLILSFHCGKVISNHQIISKEYRLNPIKTQLTAIAIQTFEIEEVIISMF